MCVFLFAFLEAKSPVIPLIKLGAKLQRKKPHFPVNRLTTKKILENQSLHQWKFFDICS
jgi:hypothetical protein